MGILGNYRIYGTDSVSVWYKLSPSDFDYVLFPSNRQTCHTECTSKSWCSTLSHRECFRPNR